MKKLGKQIIILMFLTMPFVVFSQTTETLCLRSFNSFVFQTLQSLNKDSADMSSNNIKLVFDLYVSECGKIDSAGIVKANLADFAIQETIVLSSLKGKSFPCLREWYIPKQGILPEKIVVIYNTKMLEEKYLKD